MWTSTEILKEESAKNAASGAGHALFQQQVFYNALLAISGGL
jgi:hypothetical protein